jgi:hypothetical protein
MKKHESFSTPESLFEGLKTLEVAPPPAVWADIEKSLNQRSRFRFVWLFGALGLIGAGTLWMFLGSRNPEIPNEAMASSLPHAVTRTSNALAAVSEAAVKPDNKRVSEAKPQVHVAQSAAPIRLDEEAAVKVNSGSRNSQPELQPRQTSDAQVAAPKLRASKHTANTGTAVSNLNVPTRPYNSAWASMDSKGTPALETVWPTMDALRSPAAEIPRRKRKAYNTIELFVGAGTFNQNLHMASDHADTLEFFARPGLMIQGGLQWSLNPSLSIETSVAWSKNTWDSPANLIVEPNASSNSSDVFLSTPYVFSQVTDPEAVSGLMAAYAAKREARLEHVLSYLHYRVGLNYKMVDYRKMSFYVMLQAEYMQIQSYRGQITTGEFTLPYAVDGFRKGVMGIRPGIGLGYRISPRIQFFSEAATALRTSYLTEHSGWRIYENPYGLVAGIRFGR